jgi:uncharacterized protein (UPF0335 family)
MHTGGIDGGRLRALIERYEMLEARKRQLEARKGEILDDARAARINVHVLKLTLQRRRLERLIKAGEALVSEVGTN